MTSDEAHWADARARLTDAPSDDDVARLRRRLRISWCIVGALLAGALVAAFAAAGDSSARTVTGRALYVGGAILVVVGLGVSARTRVFGPAFDSPMSALAGHRRRLLLREVHGRAPADPAHLDLARHLAHRLAVPRPALPFSACGLAFLVLAGVLRHPGGWRTVVLAVGAVFFLGLFAFGALQGHRARRFLTEHPAADPIPGSDT